MTNPVCQVSNAISDQPSNRCVARNHRGKLNSPASVVIRFDNAFGFALLLRITAKIVIGQKCEVSYIHRAA